MTLNCKHCRFCEPLSDASGVCRRHAPRPAAEPPADGDFPWAEWPKVSFGDWCGEFIEYVAIPTPGVARGAVGAVETAIGTNNGCGPQIKLDGRI